MKKLCFLSILVLLSQQALPQEASGGGANIRIYDARPVDTNAPALAIYVDKVCAIQASRPEQMTTWGVLPAGPKKVTVKAADGGGADLTQMSNVLLKASAFTTVLVYGPNSQSLKVLPVAISEQDAKTAMKNPQTLVFLLANVSSETTYTLEYPTGNPPDVKMSSVSIPPGKWLISPSLSSAGGWKILTSSGVELKLSRIPSLSLLGGHAVILPLPEATQTGAITVLDAGEGGFLTEGH